MKRQYGLYLRDIVRAIANIEQFTSGIDFQAFLKDEKTKSAVVWLCALGKCRLNKSKTHTPYVEIL